MSKYIKKLGSDKSYKRPKTTYQEKLTANQIAEKLQGYEKVDNIEDVPLNTHIRYFVTNPDGSQTFRLGGFLHNKQNADRYIMLTNGRDIWSVQVKGTVFFRKMSQKDEIAALTAMYKKKLAEKDLIIDNLKKYIKAKIKNFNPNILDNNEVNNSLIIENNKSSNNKSSNNKSSNNKSSSSKRVNKR